MERRKRFATIIAATMICGACAEELDPPSNSREQFPGVNPNWRLANFGTPRINRSPLPQGAIGGYTRQLTLTSPFTGQVRLSGKLWVRIGPNANELRSPSRVEYNNFGLACDLESRQQQQDHLPTFSQSCTSTTESAPWVEGCSWPIRLEQGANELELRCIVRSNGERSAFTVGMLELRVCTESNQCDTVDIDVNVRYQAGADIGRPNGIVIFEMTP